MEKQCGKCNIIKPLDQFQKDPNGRLGVKGRCKACIYEYSRLPHVREKINRRARERMKTDAEHREKRQAKDREIKRRINPKERALAMDRWRKNNPGRAAMHNRKTAEIYRRELLDPYIRQVLCAQSKFHLRANDIPECLVELKRHSLKLKRELKKQQTTNGKA
jgi:hypothetical protein